MTPLTNPEKERVSVTLQFNRGNMETFEAIVAMYLDSEDPIIRRIAQTATRRIGNALANPHPPVNEKPTR
jgi:hypothetical protein